jgi:hypothetical protein
LKCNPTEEHRMNTIAPASDHATWIASMPLETRLALAAAEDAGVGIGDYEGPIFYEVEVDLLGGSSNMGAIVGSVVEAVRVELDRYGVETEHRDAITAEIRRSGYATQGGYNAGIGQILRWISITEDDD